MKLVSILLLVLLIGGCADIVVERSDGTIIRYSRRGEQEIDSFLMEADGSILLEGQKSDNAELYEAINKLVDKIPTPM